MLIPTYKPTAEFVSVVSQLIAGGVRRIVVVDDGSGLAYRSYFDSVAMLPGVRLCRHAINLGKGAALKTGINTILCEYPDVTAVVTADADGQHHPDDIIAVGAIGEANPKELVLGVRSFVKDVPLRSRFGNLVTLAAMRIVVGQKLTDSQTGLRALPYFFLPLVLKIAPQGYDFELDMLVNCREKRIQVREVPIRTIYLDGNKSSHFNPLLDSMRIYFVLLRFAAVSMATAVIDALLFSQVYASSGSLVSAQASARLIAMLLNFLAVKQFVFKSQSDVGRKLVQYVTLVAVSGTLSFGLIQLLTTHLGIHIFEAKLLAESVLFFGNFLVQRDVIFSSRAGSELDEVERRLRANANGQVNVRTQHG